MQRPEQPEAFLRGCAFAAGGEVPYPRAAMDPLGQRLPADTLAVAALPVGVRFEMVGSARALRVVYEAATDALGYRGEGAGTHFELYRGTELVARQPAALGRHEFVIALGTGEGSRAPARIGEPLRLYLPEGMRPTLHVVEGHGGTLEPAPPEPRWLCYGDSIAEGWVAGAPAGAWPAIVGREQRLDTVNLGYAGSARGEIVSAEQIAEQGAAVISISHGTNCWTRTPHSVGMFREGLAAFLAVVREGHPRTPIVAISPLLRADAEAVANRLGATLADLREAFEAVVRQRIAAGDDRLTLVKGEPLLGAAAFPDGIHPGDDGHRQLSAVLGPVLRAVLD